MLDAKEMTALDRDILAHGLLSDEAYTLVEAMSDMGSRFGGTASEREAVDYMLGKMTEYGFENVRKEEFTYTGWIRGAASLQATQPVKQDFNVLGLPHCGSYSVEGELYYIGLGTPAEWEAHADEVKGKIVIVDAKSPLWLRRGIHRLEKYGRALEAGAIGFIWMRDQGGFLVETGGMRVGSPIPAVGISREEGMALIRLAKQAPDGKVRVKIEMENTVKELPSWNVMGDIPGTTMDDRMLVIGAHFDSHDIAPGSMDDASGAAVTMEAGRLLAQQRGKLARTTRIICFPVEEIGLLGSRNYLRMHKSELDSVDFMLNLDGAGRGGEKGVILQAWPELIPVFKSISENMKWPFVSDAVFGMHSDMFPFSLEGIPSANLQTVESVSTGRNWGHTICDTLDKVSAHTLRLDSTFVARLMARVANWQPWPAKRKGRDEIETIMRESGLAPEMRYAKMD